ncbi:hypothetical protein [Myxosarcina sp. GI1]|uniref:hypothetical protein n=1 Tax=Myxosarcina sp. GI1 TaxID=1541065 RepID=UPI000564F9F9|nr:hypothetical protein [Myxosarcina sp. GI1]
MPNKRSKRKKTEKFFCPYCEDRLWRLGSSKYYLFYENAREIRQQMGISAKKATFLASHHTTYLDTTKWIESFCCSAHGMLWLLIISQKDVWQYRLAMEKDWLQTSKTVDPRRPNPSVSEFSLRMSRNLC